MRRHQRVVSVGCLAAASGAFVLAAFDTVWWFLLGKRGRDFARSLDRYFEDEFQRLTAAMAASSREDGQVA